MNNFLLELGTEEIPAGYIEPALEAMRTKILAKLDDGRIGHGEAKIYGTPRRLAVEVADVADSQESLSTEVLGPPESVGFKDGKPTVAAEKFAEKVGLPLDAIGVKETKKGKYLCADVSEEGGPSEAVIAGFLPDVIKSVPFPKTMKWKDYSLLFARPVHTVIALLGSSVVSFEMECVKSGNTTSGHRFMHSEPVTVGNPGEYVEKMRAAHVMVDLDERGKAVESEVAKTASDLGGRVLPDPELVEINKNLIENPVIVAGKFDEKYLAVPDEVLITAMREHQKYFAVIDDSGKLMPHFISVNNTLAKDLDLVATGHERVLLARLADAEFFYNADLKISFDERVEKLKGVLFQAKLGTMHEKIARVGDMAEFISDAAGQDAEFRKNAARAAWLCKADLVSHVVGEFPKLQGVMGRIYAAVANEPGDVPRAIEEHYRPTYSGAPLPETLTGSVVSIADKIDSICGCFSVGLLPTGASDPYALRRQGIGIIQIMLKNNFSFSLKSIIEKSASMFQGNAAEVTDQVYTFLKNRITHLLAEEKFSKDVIAAVAEVSADNVPDVWNRVRALELLKKEPDFESLAVTFKRVVNIIRKSAGTDDIADALDEGLFDHESESALFSAYSEIQEKVAAKLGESRFDSALSEIVTLRKPVDDFFDGVLVMADDKNVRGNRLALLKLISDLFGRFADFSRIST